jgi:putative Mg2+ transporter-C (MgtC) family protein
MELTNAAIIDLIIKLVLAVVLGASLGLERSLAGKTAGMRTYTLVSLGAALFVIISEMVNIRYMTDLGIRAIDPLRVASQVVVGIGFLGAGLIIFQDNKLRGLTTAAGLWVAAGLGMAVGFGLYILALIVAVLTLFTFTALWYVENYLEKQIRKPEDNSNLNVK